MNINFTSSYKEIIIISILFIYFLIPVQAFMIDFEDIETDGYGGSGHISVSSQYANMGITFNDPIAIDFSKDIVISGFAHSGSKAIEQCYVGRCYKPIDIKFDPAVSSVGVWVGYHTSASGGFSRSKEIELIAYDIKGVEIGRSTAILNPRQGPMPISILLEVRSLDANISLARVRFSSIMNFPADNRGLVLDDIEFSRIPDQLPGVGATASNEVYISSNPSGAEIWLDGNKTDLKTDDGKTFIRFKVLQKGNHSIELRLEGYQLYRENITVPETKRVDATLSKDLDI